MRTFLVSVIALAGLCGQTAAEGTVSAADLLSVLKYGQAKTGKVFNTGKGYSVAINSLGTDVIYWQADMDIDCDGKESTICNANTDPWYQPQTSAGANICASVTPYFVIPLPSTDFDYTKNSIQLGQVAAVIYNNKVMYGPFLDECGDPHLIGEASNAMAVQLGIDGDPETGGADNGVTYIIFTGSTGRASNYTDHAQAVTIGDARAKALVQKYNPVRQPKNPSAPPPGLLAREQSMVSVSAPGPHTLAVLNLKGQQLVSWSGIGSKTYRLPGLIHGIYLFTVVTVQGSYSEKVILQ